MIRKLKEKGLELWISVDSHYMAGFGMTETANGKKVVAAGPNYFKEENIPFPEIPEQVN